jgi:hypothetical protein
MRLAIRRTAYSVEKLICSGESSGRKIDLQIAL